MPSIQTQPGPGLDGRTRGHHTTPVTPELIVWRNHLVYHLVI